LKDVIVTARSPKAIGPYSHAIKANGFVFISGQLPLDPFPAKSFQAMQRHRTDGFWRI
jgi:enamine deaminase RidA (YjgF/YER057c/UK114 family)